MATRAVAYAVASTARAAPLLGLAVALFAAAEESSPPPRRETRQFDVVARRFAAEAEVRRLSRFVFLVSGQAAEVKSSGADKLDEERLRALCLETLAAAGYTSAARASDAQIALAVGYGRGEYRPPFELMGVDPSFTPHHMWPALLKAYDESYRRLNYSNADITGFAEERPAALGELFNVLVIRAFDADELRRRRNWRLLWETRVTIGATEGPLDRLLPGMLSAARTALGGNEPAGTAVRLPLPATRVEIGEPVVVEPAETGSNSVLRPSTRPPPEE
jgi:hypothetical protein